jgi:glucose/arabinose dehydrogenase
VLIVLIFGASGLFLLSRPAQSPQELPKERTPETKIPEPEKPAQLLPEIMPEPLQKMSVEVAFPNLSFSRMVFLTHAGDGADRIFLLLQQGIVLVFPNREDVSKADVFLDITEKVNDAGNEEGLLGLAFNPEYKNNGYFYVYYSAIPPRRSVISRFSASPNDPNKADPSSELVIMEVAQPYSNHNGGNIIFGPDKYLYIGLGDGGSAGDPHGHGQNRGTLLGSILRIDVSSSSSQGRYKIPSDNPFVGVAGARGEIWAYGLRNPWRFSFDRVTGLLWAGDVGQDGYEEVDIIERGGNYGWNIMEGSHCFPPSVSNCNRNGLKLPVAEYPHDDGCSITGGYVYRGNRLKSPYGAYVYGDYCSGKIWALRFDGSKIIEHLELVDTDLRISSFGEDGKGELYILSFDGRIYRLKSLG